MNLIELVIVILACTSGLGLLYLISTTIMWHAKSVNMDIDPDKVYVRVVDGNVTTYLLGASIVTQIKRAGVKCKMYDAAGSYSSYYSWKLKASPEIIAIIKLYVGNGGYAGMYLSEFIKKMTAKRTEGSDAK